MIKLTNLITKRHTAKTFPAYSWVMDIINYDGPIISLHKDKRGKEALCCWVDCNRTRNRWCLIPITRELLRAYLTSKASLLEIYDNVAELYIFETTQYGNRTNFCTIPTSNFPREYLPENDSLLVPEVCTESAKEMAKMSTQNYYLGIDGELYIDDLFQIPKAFQQLYAFHYALQLTKIDQIRSKLSQLLSSWKGGIDSVNIFRGLKDVIPSIHRAQLEELRYNSPGHIELNLLPDIARDIERSLSNITPEQNFDDSESLYKEIYSFFRAEGLQGFDSEEETAHRELSEAVNLRLESFIKEFFKQMGWTDTESPFQSINASNLQQVRMLLAYYRRLKRLRPYVVDGNLTLGSSKLR